MALVKSNNKGPEKRLCMGCGSDYHPEDAASQLVKPCRHCNADYCHHCLKDMFTTKDASRMPPRCCALIQPYMVTNFVSPSELDDFRLRFEEWLTVDKVYCPSARCSAFISPRHLKSLGIIDKEAGAASKQPCTTQTVLSSVLTRVQRSPASRFFRSSKRFDDLPAYYSRIDVHMDLSIMQSKVDSSYQSVSDMASDFRLMYENARRYNGTSTHPVVDAAQQLVAEFQKELSAEVTTLIIANQARGRSQIFGCPKCHIAICASCKQIEHAGKPCDQSREDQDLAMLAQFGYKRCPSCRAGVKRMFGCSHMLCRCGAHWCYYCEQPIEECRGSCEEDGGSSEVEEDDKGEGDPNDGANVNDDLDRGGPERWNTGEFDFGHDPGNEPHAQIWNCRHKFSAFTPTQDKFNRGDLSQLECNLCFVKAKRPEQPALAVRVRRTYASVVAGKRKRRESRAEGMVNPEFRPLPLNDPSSVLECTTCHLIVCQGCRANSEKYSQRKALVG